MCLEEFTNNKCYLCHNIATIVFVFTQLFAYLFHMKGYLGGVAVRWLYVKEVELIIQIFEVSWNEYNDKGIRLLLHTKPCKQTVSFQCEIARCYIIYSCISLIIQ